MDQSNLPPAAKLAALIEAGRAAHPSLGFDGRTYFDREPNCGCALMFAAVGLGAHIKQWGVDPFTLIIQLRDEAGIPGELLYAVEHAAFWAKGLDDVLLSLREGELAKVEA